MRRSLRGYGVRMKFGGTLTLGADNASVLWLRRTRPAVLAAAVVALAAGCSWIQPSNQVLADQGQSAAASSGTSPSPSPPAASAQPPWARALGPGVVVTAPAPAAPGYNSPGAAVQGAENESNADTAALACEYYPPSDEASCQALFAEVNPSSSPGTMQMSNFALGWVAVDGNKALVGSTGTSCDSDATPACFTNDDPAAIFSQAKPFSMLWTESVAADVSPTFSYGLVPCVQVGGNWYVYWPLTSGNNSAGTVPVGL
jgi:hypothetical protein